MIRKLLYLENDLVEFIRNFINTHSFFNVKTLGREYISSLNVNLSQREKEYQKRIIGISVSFLLREYREKGIIERFNTRTYKINKKIL